MHDWSGVLSSSHFQSINVLLLGSVKEALLLWTPADRSTVFPFWTPLIDTSKLRGEANVSIEKMESIRTMVIQKLTDGLKIWRDTTRS